MESQITYLTPVGLMATLGANKDFDLEDFSWKALQRACEVYENGGSVSNEMRYWFQEQAGGAL